MGRADDKEGKALLSDTDNREEKDYSDKDTSDVDDTSVDPKKKYRCTEPGCTARFLRPSRLTWHLRRHKDERPYKCSIEGCTRAYTNSSHLKRHENSHNPVTTIYTCKECLVEVGSLFSLKRHKRMIHDPKRLTCSECGAKFRKKHCYNEHLSMHAGISMYKCNICQHNYPTLRLLKKHQVTHEKRKTYACQAPDCSKVFDKWSKLGKHVETEHQYVHKCKDCDKMFRTKCHLTRHIKMHANADIFRACPYRDCPRFYLHLRNLDDHIETFHNGRRFHCDTCDAALTSKASIIRHIKSYHGDPKLPQKKKKGKERRRRRDAGIPKSSVAIKLAGIKVPHELEKAVLERKSRIVLEGNPVGSDDEKEEESIDIENQPTGVILKKYQQQRTTIGLNLNTQRFVTLEESYDVREPLENRKESFEDSPLVPEQTEKEILRSADCLLQSGRLVVLENDGAEFSDTSEKNNEEIALLADQLLKNDTKIVIEKALGQPLAVADKQEAEMSILEEPKLAERFEIVETSVEKALHLTESVDT